MPAERLSIPVSHSIGPVSAEILTADDMESVFVFAHGAGAGMDHSFMIRLSEALAVNKTGTLRFNFPYIEKGRRRPDLPAVAEKTCRRAIEVAAHHYPTMPLFAGGKSFGGRMTSQMVSKSGTEGITGLVFVGFPLHAAGKPGTERANHLKEISIPMLFLQGSRDALATGNLIEAVCASLPTARLHMLTGADHSFKAGKQDLIPELAATIARWSTGVAKGN